MRPPYPGLRPFDETESDIFFGRDAELAELIRRVGRQRLVALIGPSGSGKSSLLRAGLIPALGTGLYDAHGGEWTIVRVRPGADPLGALLTALAPEPPDPPIFDDPPTPVSLRASRTALRELGRSRGRGPLLLIVDQFEEVFRYRAALRSAEGWTDEVGHFVDLLLEAARDKKSAVHVLLAMRDEFVARCVEIEGLAEVVNDSLFLLPPLRAPAVREIVVRPAAMAGAEVELDVVLEFQRAADGEATPLPVLEHALLRMWQRACAEAAPSVPERVTASHLTAIGGVEGALDRHGDELRPTRGGADDGGDVERIFRRLCYTDQYGVRQRNPAPVAHLARLLGHPHPDAPEAAQAVRAVAEPFVQAGFLVVAPHADDWTGGSIVDLAHESLLRRWRSLDRWLVQEAADVHLYRRLVEDAGEEGGATTLDGIRLERAVSLLSRNAPIEVWAERVPLVGSHENARRVTNLVATSRAAAEREREEREVAIRRRAQEEAEFARVRTEAELAKAQAAAATAQAEQEMELAAAERRATTRTRQLLLVAVLCGAGVVASFVWQMYRVNVLASSTRDAAVESLNAELLQTQEALEAARRAAEEPDVAQDAPASTGSAAHMEPPTPRPSGSVVRTKAEREELDKLEARRQELESRIAQLEVDEKVQSSRAGRDTALDALQQQVDELTRANKSLRSSLSQGLVDYETRLATCEAKLARP